VNFQGHSWDRGRGIWAALVASAVLHLLVFGAPPLAPSRTPTGQPLAATLRQPMSGPSAVEPDRVAAPRPVGAATRKAAEARPAPLAAERRGVEARTATVGGTTPAQPSAVVAAAGNAPADAAAASATQPAAPAGPAIDANGLRQFRLALALEAARFRRYPAVARDAGWAGTVEVRVSFVAGGRPQPPRLERSSGFGPLDDAALDMLGRAAPRTSLPESLRGQDFSVVLPVVFDLSTE